MAAKRKGLGKGINNLIPETDVIRSTPKKKTEKKEVVKEVVKEVIKEVKVPVPGDTIIPASYTPDCASSIALRNSSSRSPSRSVLPIISGF